MNFTNAEFEKAFGRLNQLDDSTIPEFCFSGRSNVGKSSIFKRYG
jgi:GTP-binding protein